MLVRVAAASRFVVPDVLRSETFGLPPTKNITIADLFPGVCSLPRDSSLDKCFVLFNPFGPELAAT